MNDDPEWERLSQKLFRQEDMEAPRFFWTRVLAAIESQEQRLAGSWWFQWHWMRRVATVMTLLVSLASGIVFYENEQESPLENLLQGLSASHQAAQLPAPDTEEVTAWLVEGGSTWEEN